MHCVNTTHHMRKSEQNDDISAVRGNTGIERIHIVNTLVSYYTYHISIKTVSFVVTFSYPRRENEYKDNVLRSKCPRVMVGGLHRGWQKNTIRVLTLKIQRLRF